MSTLIFLRRNIKWRLYHPFTILITILQPLLWLALYGSAAKAAVAGLGNVNYISYILPGLMVLVSFSACSSGGMKNYISKRDGSFYRILMAPVSRFSILLGQVLEAVLCAFLEAGILVIVSLLFSVKFSGSFQAVVLIALFLFLTAFFISCGAYAVSLVLPDEILYETVMNAVVLPVFFLSNALFPIENASGILGLFVRLNPFTYMIGAIRSLFLYGTVGFSDGMTAALLFSGLSGTAFFLALRLLEKNL